MSANPTTIKGQELMQGVLARAMEDDDYRQRLLHDPQPALRDAGLELSDDVEVVFHQNAPDRVHFVLPSRPRSDRDLEPSELGAAALSEYNAALLEREQSGECQSDDDHVAKGEELMQGVLARAMEDDDYRQRLLHDPHSRRSATPVWS